MKDGFADTTLKMFMIVTFQEHQSAPLIILMMTLTKQYIDYLRL